MVSLNRLTATYLQRQDVVQLYIFYLTFFPLKLEKKYYKQYPGTIVCAHTHTFYMNVLSYSNFFYNLYIRYTVPLFTYLGKQNSRGGLPSTSTNYKYCNN